MIKLELANAYESYRLLEQDWGYTDFAKDLTNGQSTGYGIIDVDACGVEFQRVDENNKVTYTDSTDKNIGIRPVIKYSYVKEFVENKKDLGNGLFEVTFGEYPGKRKNIKIKNLSDSTITVVENDSLRTVQIVEDENQKQYVLYNGNTYEVENIEWIVDEKNDVMIAKNAISSGVAYTRNLTPEEEVEVSFRDKTPRKLSYRTLLEHNIRKTDQTLLENYLTNILSNEIISQEMKNKISKRDEEAIKKAQEEKARQDAIKKEKRRQQYEKERPQRERRKLLNYYFPKDSLSAMYRNEFSEEEMLKVNLTVIEELENVKFYIEDKNQLIDLIINLYKSKDGLKRLLPYPQERYDACRNYLEQFDIDYLNVVLKETIGNSSSLDSYVEYICGEMNYQLRK